MQVEISRYPASEANLYESMEVMEKFIRSGGETPDQGRVMLVWRENTTLFPSTTLFLSMYYLLFDVYHLS
jgi:hypothetical protein